MGGFFLTKVVEIWGKTKTATKKKKKSIKGFYNKIKQIFIFIREINFYLCFSEVIIYCNFKTKFSVCEKKT